MIIFKTKFDFNKLKINRIIHSDHLLKRLNFKDFFDDQPD